MNTLIIIWASGVLTGLFLIGYLKEDIDVFTIVFWPFVLVFIGPVWAGECARKLVDKLNGLRR